jgi:hypothetical protein
MQTHVKVLAVLYLVLGVLGLMTALFMLVVMGGAAGIVGVAAADQPDAWLAMPILTIVGTALFFFLAVLALPAIVAGVGLLKLYPWARILAIVLSALNLLNVPFGTVLGIYGLWVLFNKETEQLFGSPPAPAM